MKEDIHLFVHELKEDIAYFIAKYPYAIGLFIAAIALLVYNYYAFK